MKNRDPVTLQSIEADKNLVTLGARYQQSPDNKVHGANMGPTWVFSAPDGPHELCYQQGAGPMNFAIHIDAVL